MAVEQFEVTVGDFFAVHLLQPVGQQAAVETDEVLLGQLADERGDVLVLDVGVGVVFRAGGGVLGLAVVHQELQLVAHFAVFGMFLPVDDVGFGHLVVAFGHQRRLDLVLNLFDGRAVRDADASQNLGAARILSIEKRSRLPSRLVMKISELLIVDMRPTEGGDLS